MTDVVLFEELICDNGKKIGVATLNSPKSLNALSGDMIDLLYPQLEAWQQAKEISAVFLQGAGEKALCAGGDIVKLYNDMQEAGEEFSPSIESYFTREYQLDYLIHTYTKPFIVWGHGIVMGGGLGLMVGASHRIVTESSRIAMPEISIGLYPDVGGTWFLNRMPDNCGLFLGLTGASINASDAKYTGMADYFVPAEQKQALLATLTSINWGDTTALNHEKLNDAMRELERSHISKMPATFVKANQSLINQTTQGESLAEIVNNIINVEVEDKWFNRAQSSLKHGSAISAHLVYQQLIKGKRLSLADCFRMELDLSVKCGQYGEFQEGVRALLIDKDNQPKWRFTDVESVDAATVEWFFDSKWSVQEHPLASLGK
ncbi:enoyl-CoA hydratase/isomerase family protein [Thalassotalea sp. LPB0316]|uniref:enoyl-CoA hydratase/isomerase family protein n=1 Tax=Thalassotalea sp. LPB0316 TaxID=2769490 RepID=UPI0018669C79|nr:enoyl-CoA hydratase/isomerase family protein [Thalassotalea sp. LPB0316]QOL24714.1 enoyl-CoA hydratase/isomerase family protein [Thalassotalea sp. LPB0316]